MNTRMPQWTFISARSSRRFDRLAGRLRLAVLASTAALGSTVAWADGNPFELSLVGQFSHSSNFDAGASEIASFHQGSNRLFVVNGEAGGLDVLDISNPTTPFQVGPTLTVGGGEVTSSAVFGDVVAVTSSLGDGVNGTLSFFNANDLSQLGSTLNIGPTPDMVTFTPDGGKILIAHEGEPDFGAGLDPDGSIGIFAPAGGVNPASIAALTAADLTIASFDAFNPQKTNLQNNGVRIFGDPDGTPGFTEADTTVARDLEPEFVTVSADSTKAWITLQENNALAILDLTTDTITDVVPLGVKDHSQPGQGLDASDKDGQINIKPQPVNGMFMSDAIANFTAGGETFIVLANEGDDRGEDERVKDLALDPTAFPDAATLQQEENLGRLNVSRVDGDTDGDGDFDELFSFGTRSFSIRDMQGNLVFDSGDFIEQKIAELIPDHFNSDNDTPEFDTKSDSQGPEPEGLTVGQIGERTFLFIGFEDVGGVMIFDVTDPTNVQFESYRNDRDFAFEELTLAAAADPDDPTDAELAAAFANSQTGPEGLLFLPASISPNGKDLLVVSFEVTGTTAIYQVVPEPAGLAMLSLGGLALLRRRRGA